MEADEGGVLGNLPRSRPGTRSSKRETARPSESVGRAAEAAERRGAAAARKPRAGEGSRARARSKTPPASPPESGGGTLGAAARLTGAGFRVATFVPRQVLRRLPRP